MYSVVRKLLFALQPERAHHLTFAWLRGTGPLSRGVAKLRYGAPDARLALQVGPLRFAGPVGLAAGLDKDGVLARYWPNLGFGAIELGTVTAHPQPGNPQPRLFRIPAHGALVNRMGFNNGGSAKLAERLRGLDLGPTPVGINLGKSKITPLDEALDDYATSTARVKGLGDYLVINVSSPNTPGLRRLQDADRLGQIIDAVKRASAGEPVFVKLSPDLSDEALLELVQVAEAQEVAGLIATNTTIDHMGLADVGAGGLSGKPLAPRSLEVVRTLRAATSLPLIGVGGIASASDVLAMLAAGAQAVQLYSGLIYGGPGLIHRINRDILAFLDRRGGGTLAELIATPASTWWPDG